MVREYFKSIGRYATREHGDLCSLQKQHRNAVQNKGAAPPELSEKLENAQVWSDCVPSWKRNLRTESNELLLLLLRSMQAHPIPLICVSGNVYEADNLAGATSSDARRNPSAILGTGRTTGV